MTALQPTRCEEWGHTPTPAGACGRCTAAGPFSWCVRIYANADRVESYRTATEAAEWTDFNRTFRPGNALFIDGVSVLDCTGYFRPDEIAAREATLRREADGRLQSAAPHAHCATA